MLFAVCCLMYDVAYVLFAACCSLVDGCCRLLFVIIVCCGYCALCVICCMLTVGVRCVVVSVC